LVASIFHAIFPAFVGRRRDGEEREGRGSSGFLQSSISKRERDPKRKRERSFAPMPRPIHGFVLTLLLALVGALACLGLARASDVKGGEAVLVSSRERESIGKTRGRDRELCLQIACGGLLPPWDLAGMGKRGP